MRGWAMECRIYAEDPERNFLPSPGVIRKLAEPQGPWIRVDSGVYAGWEVPVHYDPLIAKVITYGANREQAVARMKRAIDEYRIGGIRTNLQFFSQLLTDSEFLAGNLSTAFIDEFQQRRAAIKETLPASVGAHAVAAALAYTDGKRPQTAVQRESAWKFLGRHGASGSCGTWKR